MPFFILAHPRSGSSMFRLMLNAHANITVPPESGFALWNAEKYSQVTCYNKTVYRSFVDDVLQAKKFETWELTREQLLETMYEERPDCYCDMVDAVYRSYAKSRNKKSRCFGDKNNYYVKHLSDIKKHFPNEKFIFLFRDGRDIAVSYKNIDHNKITSDYAPLLSKNVKVIAEEWAMNTKSFFSFMESNDNTMGLKYEDLIKNPEYELTRVFKFLGEPFDQRAIHFNNFNDEPEEFLQWKLKTLEKIDHTNKGKYKEFLSKEEIKIFNEIASYQLLKLDYEVGN